MTAFSRESIGLQGYGCMGLSNSYGRADDAASIRTIHRALELGVTLIDTANVYGAGHNEELVGKALAGKRDKVVLATKFGLRLPSDPEERRVNGSPAYARARLEESLRRLNVDYIDLYYLHRVDPLVPIEDSVGELAKLKQEGKIGAIGLSEASADTLRQAQGVHPIAALQSEFSLWERHVEADILPTANELGIVFIAYSPLGRGFLAGSQPTEADDRRHHHPRFQPGAVEANAARRATIEAVAARHGVSIAQVSLAWVIARATVPIPGTRHIAHLETNLAANTLALSAEDIAELEAAFPVGSTVGERYPASALATVPREPVAQAG
ncbi:aldo/keto reductase [Sandaracinobacter sp. RS1-74]|uniref:aldo/keto reductase n=1 Tax=Sandaracinobacteroides sayramensis TaxID=2913411 RepID=UPI001EDB827E|nr:aldo/keto reductase [Sandaracinobacteroides sayramensis]MCG2842439.1 aldo/keto reductase [Sandaracinobacteroides sayramensis]